ncbi:unnamed protein product [Toxocara canis]|uniref:Uncharacterized protein n=1 Tax=Toxocara canis TaxID=6265 RepID=A0A183TYE2_TOXCA|nr:unnamed protein product [Toxocara canis]
MEKVRLVDRKHCELNFDFAERPPSLSVSVHAIGVEYAFTLRSQQCQQALSSMRVLRIDDLRSATVSIAQLVGHTIVLSDSWMVVAYACATVLLTDIPLLKATFHSAHLVGSVHVIQMDEQIRLIPSLHATTQPNSAESAVGNISWAFVESCDVQNVPQSSSDMELSPDEYTAISLRTAGSNLSLSAFELFVDSRPIVCESLRRQFFRICRLVVAL